MTIRYTRRARSDIEEIFAYIAKDNPSAAQRVRLAILNAIGLIAAYPFSGIKNARALELRSRLVSRYPYRVHYFVHGPDVWILHVRHSARRPLGRSP